MLKQSLNLLDKKSQENAITISAISFEFFVGINLLLFFFLATRLMFLSIINTRLSKDIFQKENQVSEMKLSIDLKMKRIEALENNKEDEVILVYQKDKLAKKNKLLAFLESQRDTIKFSFFLEDLKRHLQAGMQLDHVFLTNYGQDVDFKGKAKSSKAIAQWLSLLEGSSSYDGMHFELLGIYRKPDDFLLNFEVRNTHDS